MTPFPFAQSPSKREMPTHPFPQDPGPQAPSPQPPEHGPQHFQVAKRGRRTFYNLPVDVPANTAEETQPAHQKQPFA